MKIYSYQEEKEEYLDLKEISLVASADELKQVVKLLEKAIKMKESKGGEDHIHLQDIWEEWSDELPDIVVTTD